MKIIFVCTGNTCRSHMAQALFAKKVAEGNLPVEVESRGTSVYSDEVINPKAIEALSTVGIRGFEHTAQSLSKEDLDHADIILTMTQQQKMSITKIYPNYKYKVFTLTEYVTDSKDDISDPYGKSQIFYNFCVAELGKLVDGLYEIVKEQME